MTDAAAEAVDLMHCLGFLYLRHGQPYRAVVLLIVAAQSEPDRPELLRTLAGALIAAGMGGQAIEVLDRVAALAPALAPHPMMRLMRARALLLLGRTEEARAAFRAPAPSKEPMPPRRQPTHPQPTTHPEPPRSPPTPRRQPARQQAA